MFEEALRLWRQRQYKSASAGRRLLVSPAAHSRSTAPRAPSTEHPAQDPEQGLEAANGDASERI